MNDAVTTGWEQFLTLCQRASSSRNQLSALFDILFTIEEKETLATRVLLIQELLKGAMTQREIAQYLNISITKITRGSNALKLTTPELKQFLMSEDE